MGFTTKYYTNFYVFFSKQQQNLKQTCFAFCFDLMLLAKILWFVVLTVATLLEIFKNNGQFSVCTGVMIPATISQNSLNSQFVNNLLVSSLQTNEFNLPTLNAVNLIQTPNQTMIVSGEKFKEVRYQILLSLQI